MIVTDNTATTNAKIKGLYAAYNSLRNDLSPRHDDYVTLLPWRNYEDTEPLNRLDGVKQAMSEIADEIIVLEHSLRDPVQDAEMRAEINASIAINGNWDDCADDYLHTPMQERLYNEGIERAAQYTYDDEHGFYDPHGPCACCGTFTDHEESIYVAGYSTCYQGCYEEARAFAYLLAFITNTPTEENRWGEMNYIEKDDL